MTEFVISNTAFPVDQLQDQCNTGSCHVQSMHRGKDVKFLTPYQPYAVGENLTADQLAHMTHLNQVQDKRNFTDLVLSLGPENTMAMADLHAKMTEFNIGLMGTATSAYTARMDSFSQAVHKYQTALLAYRDAVKGSSPQNKQLGKAMVLQAHKSLQKAFGQELSVIVGSKRARSKMALTNAQRGINIANSSRTAAKLEIASHVEGQNLVKFSKHAKFLGNGLAAIDFTSRAAGVIQTQQHGGHWERELFIESASFAASATVGVIAVKAGLALLMVATPVGWVGLLVGGAVAATTAAGASMYTNHKIKQNAGNWYDSIMRWLSE